MELKEWKKVHGIGAFVNANNVGVVDATSAAIMKMTEYEATAFCSMVTNFEENKPENCLLWVAKNVPSEKYINQCEEATKKMWYHMIYQAKKLYVDDN